MDYSIHNTADVQSINIGKGTFIWQFCVVLKGAIIGENCNINCNVLIESKTSIGNNVTIKPGVQIWDGIDLEDNVFIGPNVTFTNDLVPRSKALEWNLLQTKVCKGASIGANATIIGGVRIGEYSLIGAGSLVTKDIPPYTVWYGNPATHRGFITENGTLLDLSLIDQKSGRQYIYNENKIQI